MVPNDLDLINKARTMPYQTPFFFTSRDILKHNYQSFTKLFDNGEIYYALKANSEPEILSYLDKLGCGFEAASWFEIELLLKVGVDPHKIIYGTSVKPIEHIQKSFAIGINRFAADSKEEVEKIAQHAPGARVFIRTIVDDSGSVFTMSERFGSPVEEVKGIVLHAKHLGLKTYGLSFYVGSQATNANRWANGIYMLKPVIEELYEEGITLEVLNIGGGFPVEYGNHKDAPNLEQIVTGVHNALHMLPYMPKIIMEPGRGIVASSTVLVAEVISRTVRAGRTWLCLDGGIYNALYEAMIHQGATQYEVHPVSINQENAKPESINYTLAGPTGDSLDVITRHASLPSYITIGDRLIFENTGAYTISMASPFNGFPKPQLYLS